MLRNSTRIGLGIAGLVLLTMTHQLLAQPDPGSWGPKICSMPLSNGGTAIAVCNITIEDCLDFCIEYEDGRCIGSEGTCNDPDFRARFCLKVCDGEGDTVDVKCVCRCVGETTPFDRNCTASP